MGTNFYWHPTPGNACAHCGRGDPVELLHIGKKSYGWQFHFHGTDTLRSRKDWDAFLSTAGGVIKNEYDEVLSLEEMRKYWDAKTWGKNGEKQNKNAFDADPSWRVGDRWKDAEGFAFCACEFS